MISCDEDDTSVTKGCIEEEACNYNHNATVDDGSCEHPEENYDCGGNCIADNCLITCSSSFPDDIDLIFINFLDNQKIELGYNIVPDCYGFQIDIYGIAADCDSDIDTDNTELQITCSNFSDEGFVRILGYFNDFKNELKYCDDMLFSLSYEGTIIDVRNIIFGGANGIDISVIYYSQ